WRAYPRRLPEAGRRVGAGQLRTEGGHRRRLRWCRRHAVDTVHLPHPGDPSGGEFADYVMPSLEGEVALDVIHRVQATEAPDLACRWNCKAGKCGSCSAEINGRPALMCMTRMDTLPPGEAVTVAPMRTFPILRDLVTDVSYNY